VATPHPFSSQSFFSTMQFAWNMAQGVTFRAVEDNLFVVPVFCLGDWQKLMEEGPWLFRNHGVMLKPYDGMANPRSVVLNQIHVWSQIHKIPELFRLENLVRDLANKKQQ